MYRTMFYLHIPVSCKLRMLAVSAIAALALSACGGGGGGGTGTLSPSLSAGGVSAVIEQDLVADPPTAALSIQKSDGQTWTD